MKVLALYDRIIIVRGDIMHNKRISKIIYFDKETIRNILQEFDHGELLKKTDYSTTVQNQGSIKVEASAKIKLDVPLISRISFLFTGQLDASYLIKRDILQLFHQPRFLNLKELKKN